MAATALTLLASAAAPLRAQYDPAAPEPIAPLRGALVLGGGGRLPDAVYARFVELAGGKDARIVLVTANPDTPRTADDDLDLDAWRARGAGQVALLTIAGRENLLAPAAALRSATGAFLAGPDPARLAALCAGTEIERELVALVARGGVVGANTASAAATDVMIQGGDPHPLVGAGLDLLPGAVVESDFASAGRPNRLWSVLGARPELVGLGIDTGTALIVERRYFRVLGTGAVHACVAASESRPRRVDKIAAGARGDLSTLCRAAIARTRPPFPPARPGTPKVDRGTLVIVGGGGLPPGLLQRFVELAGDEDAPIVYVPCSAAEEIAAEPQMCAALRRAGAKDVTFIHTKDRTRADGDEAILGPLRRARGVWLGGGRQWNLVDSYLDTKAHALMHEVLARGGVIGGSSAGASIQADYLARGHPLGNLEIMAEGYERGFGFVTGVAIDQHFTQRGRQPDMTALCATYPQLLGIGLDETCALVVQGSIAAVVARRGRFAHFYDRDQPIVPGRADYTALPAGARYDLAARRVLSETGQPQPTVVDVAGAFELALGERKHTLRVGLDLRGTLESDAGRRAVLVELHGERVSFVVIDGSGVGGDRGSGDRDGDGPADGPALSFEGTLVAGRLEGTMYRSHGGEAIGEVVGTKLAASRAAHQRERSQH